MIASAEDARLLFDKWKQERARVRIRMLRGALLLHGDGILFDFSPETIQLGGGSWWMTLSLTGAQYSFSDPREIPIDSVRERESARYELGLSLRLPNGDELVIMEVKVPLPPPPGFEDLGVEGEEK